MKEWTICHNFPALGPTSWADLGTCEGSLFIFSYLMGWNGWNPESGRWRNLGLRQATRVAVLDMRGKTPINTLYLKVRQVSNPSRTLCSSPVMHLNPPSDSKSPLECSVLQLNPAKVCACRQSLSFQGRKGARAKSEGERLLAEPARWHQVLRRQR